MKTALYEKSTEWKNHVHGVAINGELHIDSVRLSNLTKILGKYTLNGFQLSLILFAFGFYFFRHHFWHVVFLQVVTLTCVTPRRV